MIHIFSTINIPYVRIYDIFKIISHHGLMPRLFQYVLQVPLKAPCIFHFFLHFIFNSRLIPRCVGNIPLTPSTLCSALSVTLTLVGHRLPRRRIFLIHKHLLETVQGTVGLGELISQNVCRLFNLTNASICIFTA